MTKKELREAVQALGLTVRYSADYQEFRVNFRGGREATAYYTNDALDALYTARAMATEQQQPAPTWWEIYEHHLEDNDTMVLPDKPDACGTMEFDS